ncbi:MAG: T9SS type A sorting domain-containing protein, partial [Fidelibacterota bacterium]
IVYMIASTAGGPGVGDGGDIVAFKLENATSYYDPVTKVATAPGDMGWTLLRYITEDGVELTDIGPDVIYDPSSSKLDVFWSAEGPVTRVAQYFPAHIPKADIDAQALSAYVVIEGDKVLMNEGDELTIWGVVKNNGNLALPPFPVIASIKDTAGVEYYADTSGAPPLIPGAETDPIPFGTWVIDGAARKDISLTLTVDVPNDGATYNDLVGTSGFVYPDPLETVGYETFQDTTYTNFPTYLADGSLFTMPAVEDTMYPPDPYTGGWTVVDSSHGTFGDARDDYISTWVMLYTSDHGYEARIRHMQGVRNDSLWGDIEPPEWPAEICVGEECDSLYAQPQNELLYSPRYGITGTGSYSLEWDDIIDGTDDDYNFPIYAFVDYTIDGGTTWEPVYHRIDSLGSTGWIEYARLTDFRYVAYDLTTQLAGASEVQFRYWWRNPNNDSRFATWEVANVYFMGSGEIIGVVDNKVLPKGYAIHQNYPNPFNPTTSIRYDVPQASEISIEVYNLLGKRVASLVNGYVTAGRHEVRFDASQFASGVYFYRLNAPGNTITKKMLLLK